MVHFPMKYLGLPITVIRTWVSRLLVTDRKVFRVMSAYYLHGHTLNHYWFVRVLGDHRRMVEGQQKNPGWLRKCSGWIWERPRSARECPVGTQERSRIL